MLQFPIFSFFLLTASTLFEAKSLTTSEIIKVENTPKKFNVLVFVSSQCPCSLAHEAPLTKLALSYSWNFRFYGIHSSTGEDREKVLKHFREQTRLVFPVVDDSDGKLLEKFKAVQTPHVYVVNDKGKVVYDGGVDDSPLAEKATIHYLADTLYALEHGKQPKTRKGKLVGCAIQREAKAEAKAARP